MKQAWGALGLAMLLASTAFAADAPAPVAGVVEQPRPFGHVLGDLLAQRVLLERDNREFEPAALPVPGRVGAWLERRAAHVEHASDGARWLVVDYQIVNAPQALQVVMLPAWQLPARDGGAPLAIAPWPLSVAPLTPRDAFNQGGLEALRPDRAAPLIATRPLRNRALAFAAAALCIALAWGAWFIWRNRRDAARQPFARAWGALQALRPDDPAAWKTLHRAFDETAGRAVQRAALPALFESAPQLAPLRSDIERFYVESQVRFFAGGQAATPASPHALCSQLRRIERRHAR